MALHFWIEAMTEEEVVEKIKKVIDDKLYLPNQSMGTVLMLMLITPTNFRQKT